MSTLKRLTGNFAYVMGGHIVETGVNLLLLAIIARYLQPERFGFFAYAMSFVMMFYFLAEVGLARLLVREIARNRDDAPLLFGGALVSRFFIIVLILPLMILLINLISSVPSTVNAVYIISLWMILRLFATVYGGLFQAYERMGFDSGLSVFNIIVRLGLTVAAIQYDLGLPGVLYAMVIAQLVGLFGAIVIAELKFFRPKFKIDPGLWKFLLQKSVPIGASGFLNTAYHHINTLILAAFRSPTEVGIYNGPYRIIRQLLFLPLLFMRAPFPVISRLHKTSSTSLAAVAEQFIKFSLIAGLPVGLVLALMADRIIDLVLGSEFLPGTFVLHYYSGIVVLMFPAMVAAAILVAMDRQNLVALILAGCVLLNTVLDFFFIPTFGGIGASFATLVASFVMSGMLLYYLISYLQPISLIRVAFQPALATLGLSIFYFVFQTQHLLTILLGGGLVYTVIVFILMRKFSLEELRVFRKALKRS